MCKREDTRPDGIPKVCQAMGDPHYSSFSGAWWDYQTPCDHVLVRDVAHGLEVQVRNGDCSGTGWTGVQCTVGLAFRDHAGHVFEFSDSACLVDGQAVSTFPRQVGNCTLSSAGPGACTATYPDGLTISYQSWFTVSVTIPGSYNFTAIRGLCQTVGWVSRDEVSATQLEFGLSWEVEETDPQLFSTVCPYGSGTVVKRGNQQPGFLNCNIPENAQRAYNACLPLLTPSPCAHSVDVSPFFASCMFDYCAVSASVPDIATHIINSLQTRCDIEAIILPPQTTNGQTTQTTQTTQSTQSQTTGGNSGETTEDDDSAASSILVSFVIFAIVALMV